MKLGLREANQHFARAMRAVRAGKEVVLTDRGKPIAVIKPIRSEDPGAALRAMADEGLVTLAVRKGSMPTPRWKPAMLKRGTLSQAIVDEREDRA